MRKQKQSDTVVAIEAVEPRLLMSTNSWKAGVSGKWSDASRWSLGHVPTSAEDVNITAAGTYTVTADAGYWRTNKLTVGGASGTQTLNVAGPGEIGCYGAINLLSGDAINIAAGSYLYSYAAAGTAATLDGTVTLSGGTAGSASFNCGGVSYSGNGSVVFATGGGSTYYNSFSGGNATLGSGITVRGKTGYIGGTITNKGTIKIEGGNSDAWRIYSVNNQGSITAAPTAAAAVEIDYLNNAAGKTINLSGGSALFYYTFANKGTIALNNVKVNLASSLSAGGLGTITRTNSPITFTGTYDGGGKAFTFDPTGKWYWGGTLTNGTYDPAATNAMVLDPAVSSHGYLTNVTLSNDLSLPAGTYFTAYGNVTLQTGKRIILNGNQGQPAAIYLYGGGSLLGNGEVVFNTGGDIAYNLLGGSIDSSIGSGVVVHGKSGSVNGLTNKGTILADTAGEKIYSSGLTNNGNLIAAPGTFLLTHYTQGSSGAMTAGIGGTQAGSTFGQFTFTDNSTNPALAGKINAVLLNGYSPSSGATFKIASFLKPPTGTFSTVNVDAGNGHAFDFTQSAAALTLKAKSISGAFANRDSSGNLTITGTSGNDTIGSIEICKVLYVTLNGKTSVFFDPGVKTEAVHGNAGNDTIAISNGRGVSLFGDAGNDSLVGGSGNDVLDGGEGNDTLFGSGGDDTYVFTAAAASQVDVIGESSGNGTGSDTLDFSGIATGVTVYLTSDSALATMTNRTVKTQSGGQAGNFDNVLGGAGADKITGNSASNVIHGGLGNDTLIGGAGADSLYGEDGVDTLFGGGDNTRDLLDGGVGADIKGSADSIDTLVSVP